MRRERERAEEDCLIVHCLRTSLPVCFPEVCSGGGPSISVGPSWALRLDRDGRQRAHTHAQSTAEQHTHATQGDVVATPPRHAQRWQMTPHTYTGTTRSPQLRKRMRVGHYSPAGDTGWAGGTRRAGRQPRQATESHRGTAEGRPFAHLRLDCACSDALHMWQGPYSSKVHVQCILVRQANFSRTHST